MEVNLHLAIIQLLLIFPKLLSYIDSFIIFIWFTLTFTHVLDIFRQYDGRQRLLAFQPPLFKCQVSQLVVVVAIYPM